MTKQELDAVRENARKATTDDLMDRVTVYRGGMEPDALGVIEEELSHRGVSLSDAQDHRNLNRGGVLYDEDGVALKCSYCHRPAIAGELKESIVLWALVAATTNEWTPTQWSRRYCTEHLPAKPQPMADEDIEAG